MKAPLGYSGWNGIEDLPNQEQPLTPGNREVAAHREVPAKATQLPGAAILPVAGAGLRNIPENI